MAFAATLFLGLVVAAPMARDELVRRGYELLPDARWLEELERDREAGVLGVVLPSPTFTDPSPVPLDFERLDYDRKALYPEETPVARIDLKLRHGSIRYDYELAMPNSSYQDLFGLPKLLQLPK